MLIITCLAIYYLHNKGGAFLCSGKLLIWNNIWTSYIELPIVRNTIFQGPSAIHKDKATVGHYVLVPSPWATSLPDEGLD
jgi:hypothetical protein